MDKIIRMARKSVKENRGDMKKLIEAKNNMTKGIVKCAQELNMEQELLDEVLENVWSVFNKAREKQMKKVKLHTKVDEAKKEIRSMIDKIDVVYPAKLDIFIEVAEEEDEENNGKYVYDGYFNVYMNDEYVGYVPMIYDNHNEKEVYEAMKYLYLTEICEFQEELADDLYYNLPDEE